MSAYSNPLIKGGGFAAYGQQQPSAQVMPGKQQKAEPVAEQPPVVPGDKSKKAPAAFRTISEVASELDVQQHVLRFWETKFSQIRPLKRGGGRRYYRPEDMDLLRTIHRLLYSEGYTIKGVQKLLKENGKKQVVETKMRPGNSNDYQVSAGGPSLNARQRSVLQAMVDELKDLRKMIEE